MAKSLHGGPELKKIEELIQKEEQTQYSTTVQAVAQRVASSDWVIIYVLINLKKLRELVERGELAAHAHLPPGLSVY